MHWMFLPVRPCCGASTVLCSGCSPYKGPAVGPRQCFAVCVCPTKALPRGLGSVLQRTYVPPRPWGGPWSGDGGDMMRLRGSWWDSKPESVDSASGTPTPAERNSPTGASGTGLPGGICLLFFFGLLFVWGRTTIVAMAAGRNSGSSCCCGHVPWLLAWAPANERRMRNHSLTHSFTHSVTH